MKAVTFDDEHGWKTKIKVLKSGATEIFQSNSEQNDERYTYITPEEAKKLLEALQESDLYSK